MKIRYYFSHLLISQRVNRIGFRRLGGRIKSKEDSDYSGKSDRHQNDSRFDNRRDSDDRPHQSDQAAAQKNPYDSSAGRKDGRFRKELDQDIPGPGPQRFSDSYFSSPLRTETSMIFIIPIPPTISEIAAMPPTARESPAIMESTWPIWLIAVSI